MDNGAEFVIRLLNKFSLRVKLLKAEDRRRFAVASMIVHTDNSVFGIVMFSVNERTTVDMTTTQAPASGRMQNRYIIIVVNCMCDPKGFYISSNAYCT